MDSIEIPLSKITHVISNGDYINIYTRSKTLKKRYVVGTALYSFLTKLPENFRQIHRCSVINMNYLTTLDTNFNTVTFGGKDLKIGRSYKQKFRKDFFTNNEIL